MAILSVMILVPKQYFIDVYSFDPFYVQNCSDLSAPKLINKWAKSNGQFLYTWTDEDPVVDLMKCPVNISFMDFPPYVIRDKSEAEVKDMAGIEGNIIKIIAEKLNFSAYYINRSEQEWGRFDPPEGLLGDVYTGRSNFGFGGIYPFPIRYQYLEAAIAYNFLDTTAFVIANGAGHHLPEWVLLFVRAFSATLWLFVLLAFSFSIFFSWGLFAFTKQRRNFSGMKKFALFLGQGQRDEKEWAIRPYLLSWVWFGFIITAAYQSSMSGRLTAPPDLPNININVLINTFKELFDSDINLRGPSAGLPLFNAKGDDEISITLRKGYVKLKPIRESIAQMLIKIQKERNIAFFHHEPILKYFATKMKEVTDDIHFLEELRFPDHPGFFLQKNSCFKRGVYKIISRLNDGGFFPKWANDIFGEKLREEKREPKPLNIERLY